MVETPLKKSKAKGSFTIRNDRGLHTRPSTELVKCAGTFKSEVYLYSRKAKAHVNAKSLLGILMLAASKGMKIAVEAVGDDSSEAVDAIIKLAENNFNVKY